MLTLSPIRPRIRKLLTSSSKIQPISTVQIRYATPVGTHSTYEANTHLKQLIKTNRLIDARLMFDELPQRDEITWTTIISGYVHASDATEALSLFSRMWADPTITPDPFVLSLALKACGSTPGLRKHGESIHGYTVKSGVLTSSVFVATALMDMYSKIGPISPALKVFDEMPQPNVVSWTGKITALVRAGRCMDAVTCFAEMREVRVPCDSHTYAIALKACADAGLLDRGREIHTHAVKLGLDTASFVANTLATLYTKCGKLNRGLILFERMRSPDVVSWTTIIATYVQIGRHVDAIRAFVRMGAHSSDVSPNEYTFAAVVSACVGLGSVTWGEQVHAHVTRLGFAGSMSVANAIVTLYSRAGQLASANMVFREMTVKDIVSWSAIISGYSQEGHVEEPFELFAEMRSTGPQPNEYTLASLLSVCGHVAMLEQGRQLHSHVLIVGLENDVMVSSALINMYSKCGSIDEANRIFAGLKAVDIVSWTAMINGYAEHGYSKEAIELFDRMGLAGLSPDYVAFIGVLTACSHAGLVDLGFRYFRSMSNIYGLDPGKEHYGCMVDLLGRMGRLEDAEQMIDEMPHRPDDVVWSMLLRGCRVHGSDERGRRTAERILELAPGCAGTHITMSNLYASKGRWGDVAEMRRMMRAKGVRKEPGWSWIAAGEGVSVFVSGDRSHPSGEDIYAILEFVASRAKMAGYVPDITSWEIDTEVTNHG